MTCCAPQGSNMDEVADKIVEWAQEKGLLEKGLEAENAQLNKLQEELGEFSLELMRGDYKKSRMELGDVLVVCTIMANLLGTDVQSCLQNAYDKISKRTGKTINGQFVKDE